MRLCTFLLLLSAAALLAACSFVKIPGIQDRKDDVAEAREIEPLQVPEHMEPVPVRPLYPLPEQQQADAREGHPAPPAALVNPSLGEVRIRKMGDEEWMVAELSITHAWPRLRSFVGINRLPTARIDIENGVIETDWLQPDDQSKEKYRFRVRVGLRADTSEIFVLQAGPEAGDGWPEISDDPKRARTMLEAVSTYFVDLGQTAALVSLQAAVINTEARMHLEWDENQEPVLQLDLPFNHVWAVLALTLQKAGFFILDRNRDASIYYVAYDQKAQKKGGKRGLFGLGRKRKEEQSSLSREEAENLPQYEVHIDEREDGFGVMIFNEKNTLDPDEALELLRRIEAFAS